MTIYDCGVQQGSLDAAEFECLALVVHNLRKDFLHFTQEFLDWYQEAFGFIQLNLGRPCKHRLAVSSKGNSPTKEWSNGTCSSTSSTAFTTLCPKPPPTPGWRSPVLAGVQVAGFQGALGHTGSTDASHFTSGWGIPDDAQSACCWIGSLDHQKWRRITGEVYK